MYLKTKWQEGEFTDAYVNQQDIEIHERVRAAGVCYL